ncbi:MAG: hypothetical protein NUW37_15705 [Planctomycetes bacterium]|nr:hypothetical protein [Planctomycetota bacterium]
MKTSPRVDAHTHLRIFGATPRSLLEYMDRERIDMCWLMSWEEHAPTHPIYMWFDEHGIHNAFTSWPDRFVPMYAPDPTGDDAARKLEMWVKKGMAGCSELKITLDWGSLKLDPLLEVCDRYRLPLTMHMEGSFPWYRGSTKTEVRLSKLYNALRPEGLPRKILDQIEIVFAPLRRTRQRLERVFAGYLVNFAELERRLTQYPNIRFIGHGPLWWQCFADEPLRERDLLRSKIDGYGVPNRLLDTYDNMYADISAPSAFHKLGRDKNMARLLLEKYKHKILFGTDNFPLPFREFVESLRIGDEAFKLIMGQNAVNILESRAR